MQIKQSNPNSLKGLMKLFLFVFFFIPIIAFSQTTYLPLGSEEYHLIERMEIKLRNDSILNFSKTRPFSQRYLVEGMKNFMGTHSWESMSKVDEYNFNRIYLNNMETVPEDLRYHFKSKKPWGKTFYQTPGTLYEVHVKDFDLAVNPVLQFQLSKENNNNERLFLNTRGVTLRGKIANKIGFYTYITDNQERDPLYVQQWVDRFKAVPNEGYYKSFKTTGYDYFDARGYFTFSVAKYVGVQFGYDKNFIGNGYRSLFLSDFSNNTLFLKLNTRIWKINYQNLFMELNATEPRGPDRLLKKKYAVMHHLDIDIAKSLNIGLFEAIIFGRPDHFEFGYLNPIIFYRSIEQQNGSFDNALVGLDAKWNVKHAVQFYGQLLIDEFVLSALKENNGSWVNKWGIQAGVKYIDAFKIKNLDLQLESNRVRPFTYSHVDSVSNYTHYNQPLAHPLGANFQEFIGIARYQPAPKWLLEAKLFYWKQGIDSSNTVSYGSNIFLPYTFRNRDFGFHIGEDLYQAKTFIASFLLSYELRQNLFIDISALYRKYNVAATSTSTKTTVISIGVRLNAVRRQFEF
ncbi:MAG: capsule assembly Wzi family protein [Chitinophagales bacterium]